MSQSILPITPYVAEAVPDKKAPWRISSSVAHRMELKPFDKTYSFKKCPLLPSDPEMEFVKRYFNQGKPSNLKIRRVYCLDNPDLTKGFESALPLMEAEANKNIFQPGWHQKSDSDRRKEVIGRWRSMGDLFGPFQLENSAISQVKAFPLWHGSDFDKCLSIASSGFAFFGKHHFFKPRAEKGPGSSTDRGYFGSGIYFTNSASYSSLYNPNYLLLSWVIMREPYPVINDKPHPQKGSDMKILEGTESYQGYNAHYIPVASIAPNNPRCMQYYPCYDKQEAAWDEFVVFEKAHTVARLWVELAQEGSDPSYTISEMMAFVEEGDLTQVQTWIGEDRNRLHVKTEEGENLAYAALSGDQLSLLNWLYSQDPSLIHQIRNDKKSLPFLAVLGGRREILKFLLEKGISYTSSHFNKEATEFGYTKDRIAKSLESVNWSIWKIPPTTPYFSGREDLLSEMEKRFSSDPSQSFTKLPLVGLGGVGKSTLAAAYAHKFQSRYSLVYWIEAEKSPQSGLKDLGIELGLVKIDIPEKEALKAVLSYLNKNPGWLLIFDNAESPAHLQPFLPSSGRGHVLITSRDASWENNLSIRSFSSEESLSLLTKRTGYPVDKEAEKLAEELGHLPLALTQAGAYMGETATSYKSYLDLYLQERKELISSQSLPEDYPYSVATTWKISLDKLEKTSPESLPVLYRALYLAPDKIPKSILSEEGLSTLKFNNALKALRSYSLLTPAEELETLSIHRLVQTTLRDHLSDDEVKKTKKTLQSTLTKEWNFDDKAQSTWSKAKTLLSHLEVFSNLGADQKMAGLFFNSLGLYFQSVEINLTRSRDFLLRSIDIYKKIYEEDHPNIAIILNNLGNVYLEEKNFLEAIKTYEEVLRIRVKAYGQIHESVANVLNNLGNIYQAQGNSSNAIESYNKALEIFKKTQGEDSPDVADALNNLGISYKNQDNHLKAIEFYKKALRIYRKAYGENSPFVATSLNNLGTYYADLGNLPKAVKRLKEALEIRKKVYREEHPEVANSLNNLGSIYGSQRNFPEAIELLTQALGIRKKIYGERHPDVATSLNSLGTVYEAQNNLQQATEYYEQALQIYKDVYGEEHPDVAGSFNNLGNIYEAQQNLPKAIEFHSKALLIRKKIYGQDHSSVADSLNNLGNAYFAQNDFSKALEFHSDALQIRKKVYGEEHPDVAISLNNLGNVYREQGKFADAIRFYNESLEINKKVYGENHPSIATSLDNLGSAYQAQGDLSNAAKSYEASLKIFRKVYPENHSDILTTLEKLKEINQIQDGPGRVSNPQNEVEKNLHPSKKAKLDHS